jgi:hypothetical protein
MKLNNIFQIKIKNYFVHHAGQAARPPAVQPRIALNADLDPGFLSQYGNESNSRRTEHLQNKRTILFIKHCRLAIQPAIHFDLQAFCGMWIRTLHIAYHHVQASNIRRRRLGFEYYQSSQFEEPHPNPEF